jgi:thiamine kinase-like enzyme
MSFLKSFTETTPDEILKEVQLQKIASHAGLSPGIQKTDFKTYIQMDDVGEMCIADKYGENIRNTPKKIRDEIVEYLWTLYSVHSIQYVDVTPYNFIEKDGRLWIIDFGHATQNNPILDPYLEKMFADWKLSKWNPRFK